MTDKIPDWTLCIQDGSYRFCIVAAVMTDWKGKEKFPRDECYPPFPHVLLPNQSKTFFFFLFAFVTMDAENLEDGHKRAADSL